MEAELAACRRPNFVNPGNPAMALVSWSGPAELRFEMPAGQWEVGSHTVLTLRAAVDPLSELNAPGEPQSFSVRLTDGRGVTASVVVGPDGYTLPNAHVVDEADEGTVRMTDRREYTAKVVGLDKRSDVAVLKIEGKNLPVVTLGNPDDGGRVAESLRLARKNRTFDSQALGVYAQDMIQIAEHWKVLGGLRWDRFEGNYRTYSTAAADLGQLTAERGRTDSLPSHRFGLLYQPTPLHSYHLSYGTSFNTSGDAYQYDALGSNTPPEKSRNFELGAKLDSASGDATLRLALFHSTKYNERNRDEDTVKAINYVLSGQRHAAGLEVDVAGRITPAWEVFVSYAWIPDAEVDEASSVLGTTLIGEVEGQRPGLTPLHSGTAWSTYQLTRQLRLGGGLNFRSSMKPQQSTIEAPGYVTADLMADNDLGPVLFRLDLNNVPATHYAAILDRGPDIPGQPRDMTFTTAATLSHRGGRR